MSSAPRTTRATEARRQLVATGSVENDSINFSRTRSASSTSRTRGAQGGVANRLRQRQSDARGMYVDGVTPPVSPVASLGSPPQRRRVGRPRRTNLPSVPDATTPGSPQPLGRDNPAPLTPHSDVSREGEGSSRARDGDGDGVTIGAPTLVLPMSDERSEEGQSNGDTSERDEVETENRSSTGSQGNFDTTSDKELDELTSDTMEGRNMAKRPRPARAATVHKKRRHDLENFGDRVRHLERVIRDLKRAVKSHGDGHSSFNNREPREASGPTRPDMVTPTQPPASPASWGTIRPRDTTDRMALTRASSSSTRASSGDRQEKPTSGGHGHHGRHQVATQDAPGQRRRRGNHQDQWDEPLEPPGTHRNERGDITRTRPRSDGTTAHAGYSDGGTTSGDERASQPSRQAQASIAKAPAPKHVLTLDTSESDVDSLDSTRRSFDDDDRHGRRKPRPKLKDLSRDELIQKLEKMQRRGLSKPAVDYMALFSKYTQDYKIRFHGPQPDRFAFGKELFSEFRDRYQAYALSSGWSSGQQVAAMIRFLDGRPRAIFKEWINEGRLEAMDADVMWRLMKKRFCDPTEERQAARVELAQRIQAKGESLLAYEQVFSEMANRAGLSEEEMVERWVKNIDPEVANICRTHTAKEDLTFQEVARIARRADRQAPDARPPQVAVKKTVHTVAAVSREAPEDTDDTSAGMSSATDVSVKSINAIKDALSRDLRREMATRQLEFDETIGSLKRKLDHMQVMQVQQEPKRRDRKPIPPRPRERGSSVRLPDGVCTRCGSKDHQRCVWKDPCDYCKRPGHKDVVCFKKLRDQESRSNKQ